jgi:hypothetical protein
MKNITLSAEESLIERARVIAQSRHTTLNEEFRRWLEDYTARQGLVEAFDAFMESVRGKVISAGPYTRDEMNER